MEDSGMGPPTFGPGSGMDAIPGSGMAGDPLSGSPADPAMQPMFNSPPDMFSGRSSRRVRGGPMVGPWKFKLAVFVVFLSVLVAITVVVVVQIVSNQPPKAPSGPNLPALSVQGLGLSQPGGSASP